MTQILHVDHPEAQSVAKTAFALIGREKVEELMRHGLIIISGSRYYELKIEAEQNPAIKDRLRSTAQSVKKAALERQEALLHSVRSVG